MLPARAALIAINNMRSSTFLDGKAYGHSLAAWAHCAVAGGRATVGYCYMGFEGSRLIAGPSRALAGRLHDVYTKKNAGLMDLR